MLFSFLIPLFNINGYRKRNLEFIYKRLISHFDESEIEIIFGIQDQTINKYYTQFDRAIIRHCPTDNNSFNKSYIFNKCIQDGITGKYLVFLDSDVYFPYKNLKEQLINKNYDIIKPFTECIFLNHDTTELFLQTKQAVADETLKRIAEPGACCLIFKKDILQSINMDENFTGWGWEDLDFAIQLSMDYFTYTIDQLAVHLYHTPSSVNNNNYQYFKNKHQYKHQSYNICHKKDIGIIMSYFSPCNFKKPRANLYKILDSFENKDCPVTLVEGILPNSEPLQLPEWVDHQVFELTNKNILFLKENLYNIGINKTNYSKILFLDTDIFFDDPDFLNNSSMLLDTYDVIQPYDMAIWMNENMLPLLEYHPKNSFAKGIANQSDIYLYTYHPGFAWGTTRKFLDNIGGLYDQDPIGNCDISFAYAIYPDIPNKLLITDWLNINDISIMTNSYKQYYNLVNKYKPKVGYLQNCNCRHLYHGAYSKRNYIDRKKYIPNLINNNYPLFYNPQGILEWNNEEYGLRCLEYFKNRDEDD